MDLIRTVGQMDLDIFTSSGKVVVLLLILIIVVEILILLPMDLQKVFIFMDSLQEQKKLLQ